MIELPNPLKSVRHYKLPERQISRVSYTTNSSILVTYGSAIVVAHNIGITIYEAKTISIEDQLKDYSKPPLLRIKLFSHAPLN